MSRASIFDLIGSADNPQQQDLRSWLVQIFPKTTDRALFKMVVELEKLFEMAVLENQPDALHLLLQQGVPPDLCSDWRMTPLMWANYLGYTKIANLLIVYGANQQAKSFSGRTPADFKGLAKNDSSQECQAIRARRDEIHAQVEAGYLKPLSGTDTCGAAQNTKPKRTHRQIDNGKGIDELFKRMKTTSKTKSRSYQD